MIAAAKKLLDPCRRWGNQADRDAIKNDQANRTAIAKYTRSLLQRKEWIPQIMADAKAVAETMAGPSSGSLRGHTDQLRHYRLSGTPIADRQLLTLAAAAVVCAVKESLGLTLFDVQIHAGLIVSLGAVAEMQTGEGKTLAGILPAYLHCLSGRGVHVATTNDYLADRDFTKLAPVFDLLGVRTGILSSDATLIQTQANYAADVTFGAGHAFGFDYLRDQIAIGQAHAQPVGAMTLQRISDPAAQNSLRQRGLHCAIVDEIDHVLIDDAASPLVLSNAEQGEAPDAEIHLAAKALASSLCEDRDFVHDTERRSISLTDRGFDSIYGHSHATVHPQLVRPWHEYVVLALTAKTSMHRDVQYVIREQEVQLVDASTGRVFSDRSWSGGLHQAVQAAEGLTIRPETQALAKITRQRFYRYYETLGGMTGTATDCKREFASVYGLPVVNVPTRRPSRRLVLDDVVVESEAEKFKVIARDTFAVHRTGRPVLIGTLDIAQSNQVAAELQSLDLKFQLLNGVQDADESAIIAEAGRCGSITVATNMAGRGTDITLDEQAMMLGGLHVIVAERHPLSRVDRQLVGRCARCGDPGSATAYLSPDDTIASKLAPWIGNSIRRQLAARRTIGQRTIAQRTIGQQTIGQRTIGQQTIGQSGGPPIGPAISDQFVDAQRSQQRTTTAARMQLLQSDMQRESSLRDCTSTRSLHDCCQL